MENLIDKKLKKKDPGYSKQMHKDYEEYTVKKQIKNNFSIGSAEYEIIDIVNHYLRLLRDTVYKEDFDQQRKDVAVGDLMRIGDLLNDVKKGIG